MTIVLKKPGADAWTSGSGAFDLPDPTVLPPAPPLSKPKPIKLPTAKASMAKLVKKPAKRPKEQSSIAFPYMDLDTAITVARAFVENGGGARTRDQLAGALSQSPLSGAFIMKLSAARQFGLVDYVDGKFKLTDLGFSIVDKNELRAKPARVQAFLSVELYRKIYEDFKGKQLPPRPHGLEQTFVQMGVTQKQKTNARLAFDKSARQAGFSTLDPDRLIEPMLGGPGTSAATVVSPIKRPASFAGGGGPSLDPLIVGLLDRLPPPGESWSIEKRKKWLLTFEANLEMIYPAEERNADDLSAPKQDD
ncbi:hypothetical protein SAMN05444159_0481 [Bradyrhizobium lablabi]|uniref:Uncharacterized protein n=1 Tax=Bradyrhizobium lablabi TaxID=722472 RepID=A0A1M6IWC8_9BRAD|nr:hypothetical protein [Bradyrhizobium lablabi]SHJ38674.1 hypothetical protein SAMN05444159_0481 [Bradyrhizobium lablabi]